MGAPKFKLHSQTIAPNVDVSHNTFYNNNPFWQSSLFSDVYLRNDVPNKYRDVWEHDSNGAFYTFCEEFRDFCDALKGETFENWTERTTINRFIKPVLKLLGWSTSQQDPWIEDESFSVSESGETKTYKPDFVVVNDTKQLKYIERETGQKKINAAREESIISIEAKYWGRIDESKYSNREDKGRADKKDQADSTRSLDFDEQCLKYVEILHHDYGILTDGRTWRLFHKDLSTGSFKRCYQFNLGNLIKHVQAGLDKKGADYLTFIDNAKYFYHFFSKSALYNPDGRRFVDDLILDSRKYSDKIEDDLKLRFVSAMTIACNGFQPTLKNKDTAENLELLRSAAESHIFTILFVRYCESRNILPIRQNPEYRSISLSNMIDKLDLFNPAKEVDDLNTPILQRQFKEQFQYTPHGTELHTALLKIIEILQEGFQHPAAKFSINGFKETVFSTDELSFTRRNKIPNREFVKLLFELTYIENEDTGRFQQIAYSFFAPRQLGSIYESFLEYKIDRAEHDMAFINNQWIKANLQSAKVSALKVPKVNRGHLFFTPNNKDRKATGSFYTPDWVVKSILERTISLAVAGKSSTEIIKVKVCDPAMGSGHFLAGALDFLARKYLEKLENETAGDLTIGLIEAKRLILNHCIFGVDLNQRAVKLARMSLWLETAVYNKQLEPLNDQLRCGDSLVDKLPGYDFNFIWPKEFPGVIFDAFIGNPPWITFLGKESVSETYNDQYKDYLTTNFPYSSGYKLNSYATFVERCVGLQPEGKRNIGLVVPQTILENKYNRDIRNYMINQVKHIHVSLLPLNTFKGVTVESIALILSDAMKSENEIEIIDTTDKNFQISHKKTTILNSADTVINPRQDQVSINKLQNLITAHTSVGDLFKVYVGVVTGDNKRFLSKAKDTSNHVKILKGADLKRNSYDWGGNYVLWDPDQLHSNTEIENYKVPIKLLVRKTGDKIICSVDTKQNITEQTIYNLIPKRKMSVEECKFYSVLLNSQVIEDIFRGLFITNAKAYPYIKGIHLKELPLLDFKTCQNAEKILALFEKEEFSDRDQALIKNEFERINTNRKAS